MFEPVGPPPSYTREYAPTGIEEAEKVKGTVVPGIPEALPESVLLGRRWYWTEPVPELGHGWGPLPLSSVAWTVILSNFPDEIGLTKE
jgi:hypothetical protein